MLSSLQFLMASSAVGQTSLRHCLLPRDISFLLSCRMVQLVGQELRLLKGLPTLQPHSTESKQLPPVKLVLAILTADLWLEDHAWELTVPPRASQEAVSETALTQSYLRMGAALWCWMSVLALWKTSLRPIAWLSCTWCAGACSTEPFSPYLEAINLTGASSLLHNFYGSCSCSERCSQHRGCNA